MASPPIVIAPNVIQRMHIGLVVIDNLIGGTQKRIANLFSFALSNPSSNKYSLITPEGLFAEFCSQQILSPSARQVFRVFQSFRTLFITNYIRSDSLTGEYLEQHIYLQPFLKYELLKQIQDISSDMDILHFAPAHPLLTMPKGKPVVLEEANSLSMIKPSGMVLKWLNNGAYLNCLTEPIRQSYIKVADPHVTQRIFTAPCSFIDYTKAKVAPKERLIIFAGRMEKVKNPETFVLAIEIVAKKRRDFRALMLGTGRLDCKIDKLIAQKNLSDVLSRFYSPNPLDIMSRAAIFVSIQEFDNYPSQSLIEAMAAGCAVIASDRGDTRKLVTDEVGVCVPFSPEEIADHLLEMLDDFDKTVSMGLAARRKVMREQTIIHGFLGCMHRYNMIIYWQERGDYEC